MPGFIIGGVGGGGPLGGGPVNTIETRRKHRWLFKTIGRNGGDFPREILVVLVEASRPHFTAEEPDMHHNQEQAYFAGKHKWDPISLTWYDAEQPNDAAAEIWKWINGVIGIHTGNIPVYLPSDYKKDAHLIMRKGTGEANEEWAMFGCWPQDVDYQSLDYTDTAIQRISVTMRYDRANRVGSF